MEKQTLSLENLMRDFAQIRKAYAKLCYPHLTTYALSPCEIDILIFLSNNPSINTAKELAVYLGVAKSLIARSIDNLVKRDMIQVSQNHEDKRIQHVTLKNCSNEVITLIKEKKQEFATLCTKDIHPDEFEIARNVLIKINSNIDELLNGGMIE